MSWREVQLGDAIHVKHGFAFKGQYFSDNGEKIILTPGNFNEQGGFRLRPGKDRFYIGDIPEDYILAEGDLIVAMTEQGPGLLGSSALIPENGKYLHNQRLGLVQLRDESLFDKRFLYHLFNTRPFRTQISGSATGTKVRHTAPERIYRVKVSVPSSVIAQRKIGIVLSAYDDLIENNRRRIQLLEQAARLLYKEWFVHLRFPGHEHTQIINGVPEGWEKTTIGESAAFISRGIAPKYDDDAPGIVINQKCIRNRMVNLDFARRQSKQVPPPKLVQFGDVLINSTGAGTLGRVAQLLFQIDECTVDSHVTIVRPREGVPVYYFGLHLTGLESYIATLGRGATNQTELSKDDIAALEIVLPSSSSAQIFESIIEPTFRQIRILSEQIEKLIKARDLLLPKLMNGEVAV
jgi:type I restriction enzyme, S subunit